jgi:hypothetical protein
MRNLNLGPDSKQLAIKFNTLDRDQRTMEAKADEIYNVARLMAAMLKRWVEVAWCWPDSCPAQMCGGPHVKVKYDFDKTVEVIEPANKVGETFPDAKFTILTNAVTGSTRRV